MDLEGSLRRSFKEVLGAAGLAGEVLLVFPKLTQGSSSSLLPFGLLSGDGDFDFFFSCVSYTTWPSHMRYWYMQDFFCKQQSGYVLHAC